MVSSTVNHAFLQNLLQLVLLILCESRGESDVDSHDEIAPLFRLLTLWHTETWELVCICRGRGTCGADADLLAINGLDGPLPASQCFLQFNIDIMPDVVAFSFEQGVVFLFDG